MNQTWTLQHCAKCENELNLETNLDGSVTVYCSHCDFTLEYTKEEMDRLEAEL